MELSGSKSLLAKLMATENLIVEHRKVSTASFDVRNRILTIPILSKELSSYMYDLFTGHEVGHALYTPLYGMIKAKQDKINMSVLNVVEDSRIERKIKYKYPGLKHPFIKAYGEMIEDNFFETKGKNLDEYNLIDRINLHCKVGAALTIKFTEEERELLNAVESTETYEEVIEVTKRIIEFMKMQEEDDIRQEIVQKVLGVKGDKSETPPEESSDNKEEDGNEGDGETQEDKPEGSNKPDNSDGDDDSTGETQQNEEPTNESQDESQEPEMTPEIEELIDKMVEKAMEEFIGSKTDEAQHRNEKKIYDTSGGEYYYVNIPKVNTDFILGYKDLYQRYKKDGFDTNTKQYLKYRRESEKVVSYLVKEFELRKNADQLKRANISKTGDLNMAKIFSYQFSEDIFKKVTVVPGGKSHGLVMFLDWSGSMVDHIANTMKQLVNLTMFCKKVNIPFEVYSFIEHPASDKEFKQTAKRGDLVLTKFGLANILSSRMNSSELTFAYSALFSLSGIGGRPTQQPYWMAMSGTPLNEAVVAAMDIVPEFQKKYRLQNVNTVFLTDGEGHRLNSKFMSESIHDTENYFYSRTSISKVVMCDPVTKHQESYEVNYNGMNQTKALIKLLKLRTNSNVIGFYVANGREFSRRILDFFPECRNNYNKTEEKKEIFRKNKFLIAEDSGFDEYYILRTGGLDTDENNKFDTTEASTTRSLVNAFSKYAGSKVNNRVILNRFIDLIT